MGLISNTFQEEELSEMTWTGPRGGGRWEMHVVLQTKSWPTPSLDTWYGDAGSGQAGTFAPATPQPPHSWGAGGCTRLSDAELLCQGTAQHSTGRGDLGARTPSHLFISCVREGAIFGL